MCPTIPPSRRTGTVASATAIKFIVMPTPGISEVLKAELDAAGVTGAHYQHFPETD